MLLTKGSLKMRILAVDTSSSVASVAVMDEDRLQAEILLDNGKTHSQILVPLIENIMSILNISTNDIDVFASSIGPGSFTGLRIGITTIKAIAFASKKPVVSVPTLDALAYNMPALGSIVCPIMDARNSQVYTALFENRENTQSKLTEYLGININELIKIIKDKGENIIFTGDAVQLHRVLLEKELGNLCSFAPVYLMRNRASTVAELALKKALTGQLESSFEMHPIYLRKPQAEREYEKKQEEKARAI